MVRGRPRNLAAALASGRVRAGRGRHPRRRADGRLVAGCDIVFHQAALRITHCAAEPDAAMEVMVDATYDLLRLCVELGVRKVVMASSASVYGMARSFPDRPRTQNPYDNRTLYGAAKAFDEGLLRSFNDMYGLDYVALRYFNVYGPRMDIHGRYTEVMVRWMERLEAGEPPIIFGDGLQTMDMIHVRDVARANILAAQADGDRRRVQRRQRDGDLACSTSPGSCLRAWAGPISRRSTQEERAVNPVPRRLGVAARPREAARLRRDGAARRGHPRSRRLVAGGAARRGAAGAAS